MRFQRSIDLLRKTFRGGGSREKAKGGELIVASSVREAARRARHSVELHVGLKTALQTAGLVKRREKPGSHRKRCLLRALPSLILHIDGRDHAWFQDERRHELIVILDDATSEIVLLRIWWSLR